MDRQRCFVFVCLMLMVISVTIGSGTDGDVSNQVDYYHIGCFKDPKPGRTMPERLGTWRHLGKASIMKCANATRSKGYKAFGVQYSGECWSGVNASLTYDKYGKATNCKNGTGGSWANDVYFFYIIYVPNLDVNIAPNIKPGLIVTHFTANHKDTSLVIPPLTYTITGATTMRANAEIESTGVIDSCGFKSVSNSSFPFCIYKSQGIVVVRKNLSCSEGDMFVISINVTDSGNDTIEKTVNPNGKVTIVCKEECKNTSSLYENATKTCSTRSNLSFQLNDTKTKAIIDTRDIYAIYELHIFDIKRDTSTCYLKFNISYNSEEVSWDDVGNQTNMTHILEYPIIITGPVINITLLSNGCNTSSASLTLVFVPQHPEECNISWTCLDAVFYWKNSLFVTGCESDPYNLRMRYGHCVEKPIITTRPQPWRGRSGTHFILSCIVQKTIPARITWYRGANEINNITNEINNITIDVNDQGYYWCKADNRYGTARSRKVLLVVTDYFTSLISFNKDTKNDSCESCEQIKKYLQCLQCKDITREYKKRNCSHSNRNNKTDKVECVIYGRKTKAHEDVNSYYNDLVNTLTEGAKKNEIKSLKILWKTISVKDTDFCFKETTDKRNSKGYSITWDATRIGQTRNVTCPLGPHGSSATRTCGGNFSTGAIWRDPKDEMCRNREERTQAMYNISEIEVNATNAKDVAKKFNTIFKSGSPKDMSETEATVAAELLEKIVNIESQLNETADMVVEIIDTMMEMNASNLPANASTKVVKVLNRVAEKIPLKEGTTSRVLNSSNLAIQANKLSPNSFKGITFGIKNSTTVKLPSTILSGKKHKGSVRIGFIYFANNHLFQPKTKLKENTTASSEVLSSTVYSTDTSKLSEPVILRFPSSEGKEKGLNMSICVYWKENERKWSTEGCSLCGNNNDNDDSVACCCNHLTSFAVLFSPETEPLSGEDQKHERILGIISYIGCGISFAGVLFTFLTYSLFRHLRITNQQPILMNLCVAMALLLIVFAVGVESTSYRIGCQIVAALLHYLTLVTVLWMGIEAYNLYLQLVKVMAIYHRKFMLKASIVAWGVPGIIVIATVVAAVIEYNRNEDGNRVFYYGNDKVCILHNHLYRMISWFAPILAILFFNMVMFVLVIYKINSTGAMVPVDTKSNQIRRCWTAVAIMTLLGVTWLFGAFAISGARLVFEYLFCIFNSLQGLFIFFFHCASRKEVRNQWSFFANGLGFSHRESEYSQPRSRGVGESRQSSEAPYVKFKKWLRKESNVHQPKRKFTMVTLVDEKEVHENNSNPMDIQLDDFKDCKNVAFDESSYSPQKQDSLSSNE